MNELLIPALEIALRAEDDHPFRVALQALKNGGGQEEFVLALLHDCLEDEYATDGELLDLPSASLSFDVHDLTRLADETYDEYIARVEHSNPIVRAVKLADAEVNLTRSLGFPLERRYRKVIEILSSAPDAAPTAPVPPGHPVG